MNCFLIISNSDKGREFVNDYITKNKVLNVLNITDKIGVDTIRDIIKTLSLKLKSEEKRVIILDNEITIEAQNALLKSLEELSENTHFFILSKPHFLILPTIISRCKVIRLNDKEDTFQYFSSESKNIWNLIDKIDEQNTDNFNKLKFAIQNLRRNLLSENLEKKDKIFIYASIKSIYRVFPLVINNNVNIRIALEKVFLGQNPQRGA